MSVDFYPADDNGAPLLRCACYDALDSEGPCASCLARVNMSDENAAAVMRHIGLERTYAGSVKCISASQMWALLEAADPLPEEDAGTATVTTGRVTHCGRPVGYLARRVRELRTIAKLARGRWVAWS